MVLIRSSDLVVSRRFWRAPVVTQSSLCSFVCVHKLFSYLLVIISPNIDVHLLCSWEGTNCLLLCHHPDPACEMKFFLFKADWEM